MSGGIINIKNIYLQFNGALQVNYFTFYLGFFIYFGVKGWNRRLSDWIQ